MYQNKWMIHICGKGQIINRGIIVTCRDATRDDATLFISLEYVSWFNVISIYII